MRILSNGEEAGKGNQLVIASSKLLEQTPGINFQGNIESKDVPKGLADVVVTDGFTGNIFVKTAETTASLMNAVITEEIKKSPIAMLGALMAKGSLQARARTHGRQPLWRGRAVGLVRAWSSWRMGAATRSPSGTPSASPSRRSSRTLSARFKKASSSSATLTGMAEVEEAS